MFLDTKYYTSIPIFVLFVLSFGISNAEQAPNIIGEYNNWTALTYKERGKIVCFMSPAPKNSPKKWVSKPKNVRRGKIYLLVTHRPAHGTRDEVVPLNLSKKILKICKKSKKKIIKIKNGDHSLSRRSDLKKICRELKYMISNN